MSQRPQDSLPPGPLSPLKPAPRPQPGTPSPTGPRNVDKLQGGSSLDAGCDCPMPPALQTPPARPRMEKFMRASTSGKSSEVRFSAEVASAISSHVGKSALQRQCSEAQALPTPRTPVSPWASPTDRAAPSSDLQTQDGNEQEEYSEQREFSVGSADKSQELAEMWTSHRDRRKRWAPSLACSAPAQACVVAPDVGDVVLL